MLATSREATYAGLLADRHTLRSMMPDETHMWHILHLNRSEVRTHGGMLDRQGDDCPILIVVCQHIGANIS